MVKRAHRTFDLSFPLWIFLAHNLQIQDREGGGGIVLGPTPADDREIQKGLDWCRIADSLSVCLII